MKDFFKFRNKWKSYRGINFIGSYYPHSYFRSLPSFDFRKQTRRAAWVAHSVEDRDSISAQVMIPGRWDPLPKRALC